MHMVVYTIHTHTLLNQPRNNDLPNNKEHLWSIQTVTERNQDSRKNMAELQVWAGNPGSPRSTHHTAGAPLESSFLQLFGESHSLNGVSSHGFVESFPTAESNSGSAVHVLQRHKGNP